MFIVTGTPRSATGYASLLFKAMDIPCTHEQMFTPIKPIHETVDWAYSPGVFGESSWLAWCYLSMLPPETKVLHTLRDPTNVIDSLANRNDLIPLDSHFNYGKKKFRELIFNMVPRMRDYTDAITRSVVFYIDWINRIDDAIAASRFESRSYNVEDLSEQSLAEIVDFIGAHRTRTAIASALKCTPTNVNGGKQIDRNLEITNPEIREAVQKAFPGVDPVIEVAYSRKEPMTREAILAAISDESLKTELIQTAQKHGYWS